MQTGRTEETQVIPWCLSLNLMIALGTLAPKTNLRQMGEKTNLRQMGRQSDPTKFTFGFNDCVGNTCAKTYLRQMGQNKLAPDGAKTYLRQMRAKTNLRQMGPDGENKLAPDGNKLAPDGGQKQTCARLGGTTELYKIG
ncbi:MAG: hypothetical protein IPO01_09305 [Chitinophagaceae bacterium]|nr:hypothetical protein [Chitinophagaceae bacterium]